MEHHALYRRFRPTSFADVVGQEAAVALLQSAIAHGRVSHAYLFIGGRGSGKTTSARIFARELGVSDIDYHELDAATHRGIDEMKKLIDQARQAPFNSPYKVYVLDEAHQLTKEAANAFLKTLEEPQENTIFILATTNPEKLPDTIISRCQIVRFVAPGEARIIELLESVSSSLGYAPSADLIAHIADAARHSYRDSLVLLEQAYTLSKDLAADQVLAHMRPVREVDGEPLLKAYTAGDAVKVAVAINTCMEQDTLTEVVTELVALASLVLHARLKVTGAQASDERNYGTHYAKQVCESCATVTARDLFVFISIKDALVRVSRENHYAYILASLLSGLENKKTT